jgi:putative lipoprotein
VGLDAVTRTTCILLAIASTALAASPARAADDPWLANDKYLHFGVSAVLAGGTYGLGVGCCERRDLSLAAGAGIGLGLGIVKELLDLTGSGRPSWKDFAWDVAGVATGLAISLCIDLIVRGVNAGWGDPGPALAVPRSGRSGP